MEKKVKTIKLFDGIKMTTADEITKYPDMTIFNEVIECDDKTKGDIITVLLCQHTIDLTQYTRDGKRLILDLYSDEKEDDSR
ncbi:MAG: hypothetical protein AB7D36_09065 [Oscillospiraceae bacterium]